MPSRHGLSLIPVLDQLAPVCGARIHELKHPPGPEIFAGVNDTDRRIETLVRELFACYARAAPWLDVALWDQRQVAPLDAACDVPDTTDEPGYRPPFVGDLTSLA